MKKQLLFLFLFLSFNALRAQSLTATTMIVPPRCFGEPNGLIQVMPMGGVAPYTFSVMSNQGQYYGPTSNNMFTNLFAGVYTVTVLDSSIPQQQTSINVVLPQPAPLFFFTNVSDHTITVTVQNYSYMSCVYSLNGGPYQSSNVFSNVAAGTHAITVMNYDNCTFTNNVVVNPVLGFTTNSSYVDYNNDGFTNVGDVVNYQFTVTNTESSPMTNLTLSSSRVTINGSIATLNPGASDATTFTGTHVITQQDINNGLVEVFVSSSGTYNGSSFGAFVTDTKTLPITDAIKLNAFIDANANGVQDNGEQNFTLGNLQYQMNNDGINHNISASTGAYYIYETNPANSYNVNYSIGNLNPLQYSLGTSSYSNITVATGSGVTTYNFPVTALSHQDFEMLVSPNGASPRPGFTYSNRLMYRNNGNQTIASGSITFNKDNAVTITSISQTGTIATATGFTYDFTNLLPGETRDIYVTMQVPTIPTVTLGQVLTNDASATVSGTDMDATNNTDVLAQTIVGSYDPNDKTEAHGGKILYSSFSSNDYLTYTIQFENTGTANAVNVRVNDVLDAKLDETSVKMINASHAYTLDRVGNNLNWNFDGIELEPSVADTTIGKGYINFQVKPKPGFVIGDIIPNTASIFFDFNPAIVTNTFNTEFVATLSVSEFEKDIFSVYPNPTNGIVTIALRNNTDIIDSVVINDVLGKTVLTNTINNSRAILDLSNFSKGVYFVKVQSKRLENVMKIVKQ